MLLLRDGVVSLHCKQGVVTMEDGGGGRCWKLADGEKGESKQLCSWDQPTDWTLGSLEDLWSVPMKRMQE